MLPVLQRVPRQSYGTMGPCLKKERQANLPFLERVPRQSYGTMGPCSKKVRQVDLPLSWKSPKAKLWDYGALLKKGKTSWYSSSLKEYQGKVMGRPCSKKVRQVDLPLSWKSPKAKLWDYGTLFECIFCSKKFPILRRFGGYFGRFGTPYTVSFWCTILDDFDVFFQFSVFLLQNYLAPEKKTKSTDIF